ncbi:lasso peptide biosynthesis PqqD family chaperone [Bacillus sp. ISL-37]|uniref:lasso peptide biosynthesis PqqD family chaperone n=1 Tax=Bacillus sp. ISL-37 TaxID=2819123 RepID=UPI001BEACB2B|nr:lasso peptide biosynthesis PqqD family chaperone [Bacillus sp. ISL-37]MBT2686192.1 lasso peptide biosynthesis PqqD family chaperone [Bacillus sp. ISL-37]
MLEVKYITMDCSIKQQSGNIISNMDGNTVMMNIEKGKYYNLGEIGGEIWNLVEKWVSVPEVIEQLVSEYHVDEAGCQDQVLNFLEHLKKEGLIEIKKV